jgi:hypothetical protein
VCRTADKLKIITRSRCATRSARPPYQAIGTWVVADTMMQADATPEEIRANYPCSVLALRINWRSFCGSLVPSELLTPEFTSTA